MMNRNDLRDLNYDWDAERAYRLLRRRNCALFALLNDVAYALMALAAFAVLVWMCWRVARQPVEERAAYLEGRFGLDRATAMAYAEVEGGRWKVERQVEGGRSEVEQSINRLIEYSNNRISEVR